MHVLCMGSGSATGFFYAVRLDIGAFFTEIFFKISVVILNSNLHYQIFKFVIDNSDISLNCLQHIQKRSNFDAKVTCHQPICLLLHAILSGVGVPHTSCTSIDEIGMCTVDALKYVCIVGTFQFFGEKRS